MGDSLALLSELWCAEVFKLHCEEGWFNRRTHQLTKFQLRRQAQIAMWQCLVAHVAPLQQVDESEIWSTFVYRGAWKWEYVGIQVFQSRCAFTATHDSGARFAPVQQGLASGVIASHLVGFGQLIALIHFLGSCQAPKLHLNRAINGLSTQARCCWVHQMACAVLSRQLRVSFNIEIGLSIFFASLTPFKYALFQTSDSHYIQTTLSSLSFSLCSGSWVADRRSNFNLPELGKKASPR